MKIIIPAQSYWNIRGWANVWSNWIAGVTNEEIGVRTTLDTYGSSARISGLFPHAFLSLPIDFRWPMHSPPIPSPFLLNLFQPFSSTNGFFLLGAWKNLIKHPIACKVLCVGLTPFTHDPFYTFWTYSSRFLQQINSHIPCFIFLLTAFYDFLTEHFTENRIFKARPAEHIRGQ